MGQESESRNPESCIAVEILEHPEEKDWARCRMLALATQGKESSKPVSDEWKKAMLRAGHSPIRTLRFLVKMDIPYYCSVHLCRHKIGVEHFVRSQRTDRNPTGEDRSQFPQGAMVTHVMEINAQALMQMAHMRLCNKADIATRSAVRMLCQKITELNPEFKEFLVPKCLYLRGCNEIYPCGKMGQDAFILQ